MKTWLITGGCGFIGSNFIQMVLETQPEVRVVNLDALTYAGNPDNLLDYRSHQRYSFHHGDIYDRDMVISLFKAYSIDVIVNFAAESHVDRSITSPGIFVQTNVSGTASLLDVAYVYWGNRKKENKFIQVSTDEVYGSLPDTGMFTEDTPIAPNSPYSASKAGGDMLAYAYYKTYGLPICITRCSNNYGPYQFPEKLIPLMIQRALCNEPLPVYGDGLNVRDWLHVSDHCRAILTVIHNGKNGEIYNIGGFCEHHNIDIVKAILHHLGKPESLITFVPDRLGHDRRYAIDSTKIKNALHWNPLIDFDSGLKDTVQWYIDNETWRNRILSGEYRNKNYV